MKSKKTNKKIATGLAIGATGLAIGAALLGKKYLSNSQKISKNNVFTKEDPDIYNETIAHLKIEISELEEKRKKLLDQEKAIIDSISKERKTPTVQVTQEVKNEDLEKIKQKLSKCNTEVIRLLGEEKKLIEIRKKCDSEVLKLRDAEKKILERLKKSESQNKKIMGLKDVHRQATLRATVDKFIKNKTIS